MLTQAGETRPFLSLVGDGRSVAAWLLPFSFSAAAGQNFVLVFGDRSLRIANVTGLLFALAARPLVTN